MDYSVLFRKRHLGRQGYPQSYRLVFDIAQSPFYTFRKLPNLHYEQTANKTKRHGITGEWKKT